MLQNVLLLRVKRRQTQEEILVMQTLTNKSASNHDVEVKTLSDSNGAI